MEITVTSGIGSAHTELASFDKALDSAGIANYNLVYLSSIIPPQSNIKIVKPHADRMNNATFGRRLYCVMAKKTEIVFGKEAWAGIGWVQTKDGRGLFVEHNGENRRDVEKLITKSLNDMVQYREDDFGKIDFVITGMPCEDRPVCALVAALYKTEGWE